MPSAWTACSAATWRQGPLPAAQPWLPPIPLRCRDQGCVLRRAVAWKAQPSWWRHSGGKRLPAADRAGINGAGRAGGLLLLLLAQLVELTARAAPAGLWPPGCRRASCLMGRPRPPSCWTTAMVRALHPTEMRTAVPCNPRHEGAAALLYKMTLAAAGASAHEAYMAATCYSRMPTTAPQGALSAERPGASTPLPHACRLQT